MLARVSFRQGRKPAVSAKPPHRLTTRSPSTQTATAAPTSSRSVKLDSKASRTRSKPGAHEPLTGTPHSSSKDPPLESFSTVLRNSVKPLVGGLQLDIKLNSGLQRQRLAEVPGQVAFVVLFGMSEVFVVRRPALEPFGLVALHGDVADAVAEQWADRTAEPIAVQAARVTGNQRFVQRVTAKGEWGPRTSTPRRTSPSNSSRLSSPSDFLNPLKSPGRVFKKSARAIGAPTVTKSVMRQGFPCRRVSAQNTVSAS